MQETAEKMKLSEIIDVFVTGDWGNESSSVESPHAVSCVRGADIVPIGNNEFGKIPLRYISDRSFQQRLLQVGDIVVEKSGGSPTQSTGRAVYISQPLLSARRNIVCSNFCVAFRVKDGWNPYFIYLYWRYLYNSGVFFNFEGKTSGIKNLQLDMALSTIEIEPYSIEEQIRIADCLFSIEKKLQLNRSINHNLEAMAKQLYDYWFVQFDFPDENGKPYKSSGGKMVWNEKLKREIPEGWDDVILNDFLIIKNGRDHKLLATGNYPVYGSGGEMRRVSAYLYNGEAILMPRKGSLNNIMYVNKAFWTVDTMFYSEMKIPNCAKYVFFAIKDIDFTRWDSGTGVPSMTASLLYSIPLVKPNDLILQTFDNVLLPIFQKLEKVQLENENLTKLRDSLLPLLMNGQVSVNYDLSND